MRKFLLIGVFFMIGLMTQNHTNAASYGNALPEFVDAPGDDIRVFPNPASDYFQVVNGLNVRKIVIFNIFGKEVKSFIHSANAQHDITDIKAGMYLVRMLDDRNKVVKSVKLHKNAG